MKEENVAFVCADCKKRISLPNTELLTCSGCGKDQDLSKNTGLIMYFSEKDALVGQ